MADKRQLNSIAQRYDIDVSRRPDPWRILRSRLSYVFFFGSIAACIPWVLGDHRAFQSQCVSDAHRGFEQNCNSCHERSSIPFVRMITLDNSIHSTSDKKCQKCHKETITDHLSPYLAVVGSEASTPLNDTDQSVGIQGLPVPLRPHFAKLDCADCHQEHRGHSNLKEVANAECSNCHNAVHKQISNHHLELQFADFEHHPEFDIWRPKSPPVSGEPLEGKQQSSIVAWEGGKPVDQSKIRFSHHRHLDTEIPIHGGKSTSLNCTDCHRSDPSGSHFLPIQFERDCRQCHKLGFKSSTGELPHSSPEIIRGILLDRLHNQLINPPIGKDELPTAVDGLGGPTKSHVKNTKPGIDSLYDQVNILEEQLCADIAPKQDGHKRPEIAGLLEAACTKCHYTERNSEHTPGKDVAWKVIPPKIPGQWMNHARFRHDRHASVDCQACHTRNGRPFETVARENFYPALTSDVEESSSIYASGSPQDILMPRIEICHQCHGHQPARSGISSVKDRCVDCHNYHHTPTSAKFKDGVINFLKSNRKPALAVPEAGP